MRLTAAYSQSSMVMALATSEIGSHFLTKTSLHKGTFCCKQEINGRAM